MFLASVDIVVVFSTVVALNFTREPETTTVFQNESSFQFALLEPSFRTDFQGAHAPCEQFSIDQLSINNLIVNN